MSDTALRDSLLRWGLRLEYLTLGWNVIGTIVVILAAFEAGSVALTGFAIDSLIEIFASAIVVWQLKGGDQNRERRALRLIGAAFFALAFYILFQSAHTLLTQTQPHKSLWGILWLAATLIAMLLLAWGKHQTGKQLSNPVLLTEARVTLVDAYLACAVLVGLILNTLFGWWWADPLSALIVVFYGIREGWHAWHEGSE